MILTPELKEMLLYVKSHPDIFVGNLKVLGDNYNQNIDYLESIGLVEKLKEGKTVYNKFHISVAGEVFLETERQTKQQHRNALLFKLLDLIVPTITALIGVWLGSKLG